MLALFYREEKLQVRKGNASFLRAFTLRQSDLRATGNHKAPSPSLDRCCSSLHFLLMPKPFLQNPTLTSSSTPGSVPHLDLGKGSTDAPTATILVHAAIVSHTTISCLRTGDASVYFPSNVLITQPGWYSPNTQSTKKIFPCTHTALEITTLKPQLLLKGGVPVSYTSHLDRAVPQPCLLLVAFPALFSICAVYCGNHYLLLR